ncbi:Transketolase, thiamine diphosphate binding domain-containing protein [Polychytrium aggregatum]|uniref:Transketolase, thiamine diphosphate binding domain-containing protein n=1 Tax=Polychytrium aggregatum TaxID=110093 RepID=UPI0022FED526|nr:Transketolase, thiamine diphosphate binding domain-containing protein [Polychytrium aggregatum]XP_052969410.1 Transketolase, thiamine diphosphate binding domain-containing protein [Polychytrium aggregatum]KAI9204947.1 Transketolase, thiamine diphosphate binding domain-containing protein [Polychytrium aggregatum]KAI9207330.1 Transketolase, thiamine diphosphate binding domain-containing protein [Polychytrium aggregatum]
MADIDTACINTIRCLAPDVVQKANAGHPGAPMGCAPMAHILFSRFIRGSPAHPKWINRDRFVLSNGHACALQYILLHLTGYNISLDDLKSFRQLHSKTPGHPETNHGVDGIEVTTGPLGQGVSSAVGLAMAEAHLAATFNRPGFELINNYTYCILGDGCLQEGVQAEAVALAGHLQLGKLICLYDDNHITIDGDTALGFTEDVCKRFEAYGWHTQVITDGDHDIEGIARAIEIAQAVADKPSLIKIRTTIGYGSKNQGEEKVHGSPLGEADILNVKAKFGFPTDKKFYIPDEVYGFYKNFSLRGQQLYAQWTETFATYGQTHPELHAELSRRLAGELPAGWKDALPKYTSASATLATRKTSEAVFNAIAERIPEIIGGSADLTGSNNCWWKTAKDFQPPATGLGTYAGRYIRFGVREHGMAAICNGLHAYGGLIPFGATFFNFIGYALGAVRLSSLSKHQVLYVMTHDSIGLGEDGPTHQPIETLAELRALPNTLVIRPADGHETNGAYIAALENRTGPTVLVLTRQNLPHFDTSSAEGVLKGAYVLQDVASPQVILVATGSEVSLAVNTAKELANSGVHARVVSFPSWELFEAQSQEYKDSVFPEGIPVLSIEALSTFGWDRYAHASVGVNSFGISAPASQIYKTFGLVPDVIAEKAKRLISYYSDRKPEWKLRKPF